MYKIDIPKDMWIPWTRFSFTEQGHFELFKKMLFNVVEEQRPMTVRQVFYRAVVKGWVEKTEKGYGFIQRNLADMRRIGMLPYSWIVDESRRMRGWQGSTLESVDEFMEDYNKDTLIDKIADEYSIDLLGNHEFSIQIWLEKEALLGVVEPVTSAWGVPLCPAKGYASLSFLYKAAQDLEEKNRPAKIFHFGDYDPSGQDTIATVQRDLPELAPITARLGLEFEIVAVTPEQMVELSLPTRPTKTSDPRAAGFGSESVELDAIEPRILRQMVEDTIASCFPPGAQEDRRTRQEEGREEIRQRLRSMLG